MNLQEYQDIADDLINVTYKGRNTLYTALDAMFNLEWSKPSELPDWIIKNVSTEPRDAAITTVRTFATLRPRFKIMPLLNDEANRDRANQIETALGWNYNLANKRSGTNITWDILMSAVRYGMSAAQVIYLPYQEKILEAMGKDTKRIKAAKRFGDFAFVVHNPANIYPTYSEYGLESVLAVRVQTGEEFRNSWGKLADKIDTVDDVEEMEYVTTFDYYTNEKRCVWAVASDVADVTVQGNGVIILEEDNKLGFIPYACRRFGDGLSLDSDKQVIPLLQSVYKSGQWDWLNIYSSLSASLEVKRAARPEYAGEFPPGTSPVVDNTEPSGTLELPQGTRNFIPLPAQATDSRLAQGKAEFQSKIWQSTIARALQSLEFPSGTAYSSVNQVLSMASKSVGHYKSVGQDTIADLGYLMLCWVAYYGKEYSKVDLYGQYDNKAMKGTEIRLASDTLDPEGMQIDAQLYDDLPVDKLQQINGAVLAKNNFNIPESDLVEDLGYGDPSELKKRRQLENYENAYIQTDLQKLQMQAQLEMQQAQMQMQQQAQQVQMQAQQEAQMQQAQLQQQSQAMNNASPANQNLGGDGFNPAQGGTAPVQGNRGQQ